MARQGYGDILFWLARMDLKSVKHGVVKIWGGGVIICFQFASADLEIKQVSVVGFALIVPGDDLTGGSCAMIQVALEGISAGEGLLCCRLY